MDDPIPPRGQSAQSEMPPSRTKRCREIVAIITKNVSMLLQDAPADQQEPLNNELFRIVENATRLSCTLSTQYPKVEFHFLTNLGEPKFKLNDRLFRPHGRLSLDENSGDSQCAHLEAQSLVNKPIDMVVTPVVRRYGNQDGENYQQETIVQAGTIWMVKEKGYVKSGNILPQDLANVEFLGDLLQQDAQDTAAPKLRYGNKAQLSKQSDPTPSLSVADFEQATAEEDHSSSGQEKSSQSGDQASSTKKIRRSETESHERREQLKRGVSAFAALQKQASATSSAKRDAASEPHIPTDNKDPNNTNLPRKPDMPASRAGATADNAGKGNTFLSMEAYLQHENKTKTGASVKGNTVPSSRKRKTTDEDPEEDEDDLEILGCNTAKKKLVSTSLPFSRHRINYAPILASLQKTDQRIESKRHKNRRNHQRHLFTEHKDE